MSARAIADQCEREAALDPRRSFIVQAPAGSGKTELLIRRYLALLTCVDEPEEVVAITFTRKAAAEMRERVLRALAGQDGAAHGGACAAQILANPQRMRIQTIDSLCATLTRQMPMLARFGAQPETIEDARELYEEAARASLALVESDERVAGHVERLLTHLDNDYARIEALLADMLARRDHWLRHVRGRARDELEASLARVRGETLARLRAALATGRPPSRPGGRLVAEELVAEELVAEELVAVAGYAFANLGSPPFTGNIESWTALADLLLTQTDDWRSALNKNQGFPTGKPAQAWKERALALLADLRGNEALRAALADTRRLPPLRYSDAQWDVLGAIMELLPRAVAQLKLAFQSRGQVDFTEVAQGALRALGEEGAPTDLALALDYRIRHLLIDEFQDTSISHCELVERLTEGWEPGDGRTLFAVGDPMQSIYRFREAEVGLFLKARSAGIGGVRLESLRLAANFRSQAGIVDWVNMAFARVMPAREDIATGAVPYTPSAATKEPLAGEAVTVHPFLASDAGGEQAAEAARVVEIIEALRDAEPQASVAMPQASVAIPQASVATPQASVAILVRNRGALREIVPQLKRAGLRFRAIEIESLAHRPVVQDLLALTRALAHPADRLAWLAVLRAPWCGLSLADLNAVCSACDDAPQRGGRPVDATVWERMHRQAGLERLSPEGRARLARTGAVLRECIAQRERGSLRERVEGAWLALGGPACMEDATDLEDAEIYLDHLEAHEQAGAIADAADFAEGLDRLYALPDLQADERLQIMTIHKAKGLEFDHVIVPALGRAQRTDDKRLLLWMEKPAGSAAPLSQPGRRGQSTDLLLAPIQEAGADSEPIYAWLQRLDAEKNRLEATRLLYVAATRARQRLHLLGTTRVRIEGENLGVQRPGANTLLAGLWDVVGPQFEAAARARQAALAVPASAAMSPLALFEEGRQHSDPAGAGSCAFDQTLVRLAADWRLPAAPASAAWSAPAGQKPAQDDIEFSWAGEIARHVGSVVHRWLQRIAEDELRGWDRARIEALRARFAVELGACGVALADIDAALGHVAAALTNTLEDERGRWLLGAQQDAASELRVRVASDGGARSLVIDRTFHAGGRRWIVDYKTSRHEGADPGAFLDNERKRYAPQLERYAAALGGAQLGLYFPILRGWREWEA